MAKFFVGQRVRLVVCGPNHLGDTGTITALYPPTRLPFFSGFLVDCDVAWDDGYPNPAMATSRLEPIYDGNEKTSWSECLWQPTPERTTVPQS